MKYTGNIIIELIQFQYSYYFCKDLLKVRRDCCFVYIIFSHGMGKTIRSTNNITWNTPLYVLRWYKSTDDIRMSHYTVMHAEVMFLLMRLVTRLSKPISYLAYVLQ